MRPARRALPFSERRPRLKSSRWRLDHLNSSDASTWTGNPKPATSNQQPGTRKPGTAVMTSRRVFLRNGGLALLSLGFAPTFLARTAAAASTRTKLLIAIFQRGAVDGLNVVVP